MPLHLATHSRRSYTPSYEAKACPGLLVRSTCLGLVSGHPGGTAARVEGRATVDVVSLVCRTL